MIKVLDEDKEILIENCHKFIMMLHVSKDMLDKKEEEMSVNIKNGLVLFIDKLRNNLIEEVN